MRKKKRSKTICEICGNSDIPILHRHHIIPRSDKQKTSNSENNIAYVCPNCHSSVHLGEIVIIGVYDTTDGIKIMWFRKGEIPPLPEEHWKIKNNPLVITLKKKE